MFPTGRFEMTSENRLKISQECGFKSHNTLKNHLNKMISLDWIYFDLNKNKYVLRTYQRFVKTSNIYVKCSRENLLTFRGFLGAVLFTHSRNYFWRKKLKKEANLRKFKLGEKTYYMLRGGGGKVVVEKGAANEVLPPSFLKFEPAPAAINGLSVLFDINPSKIDRLKRSAIKEGYVSVEKSLTPLTFAAKQNTNLINRYIESGFVKNSKGKLILQEPDLVKPRIIIPFVKKRKHK
jgi:hypothetical protein